MSRAGSRLLMWRGAILREEEGCGAEGEMTMLLGTLGGEDCLMKPLGMQKMLKTCSLILNVLKFRDFVCLAFLPPLSDHI